MHAHDILDYLGIVVVLAGLIANIVPPNTIVGKALHWIALNGPGIQKGVQAAREAGSSLDSPGDPKPTVVSSVPTAGSIKKDG